MPSFVPFPRLCTRAGAEPARLAAPPLIAVLFAALAMAGCGGAVEADLDEVRALHEVGDFNSSIETLRGILAREPDLAEANYLLGVSLLQTRQPSLAIWPLRKATEDEEYAVPAGILLATTLIQTDSYEEAIRATDRVLEIEPDRLAALQIRAQADLGIGDPEAALIDTQRILELEPGNQPSLAARATALTRLERFGEAEAVYQEIEKVTQATDDPAVAVRGCVALAGFYVEYVEEKAEAAIEECLSRYANEILAVQTAARYFDRVDQTERATKIWREAVDARPDDFGLRSSLAARLQAKGDTEGALALRKETAELFDDANAWSELAAFYQAEGDMDAAVEANDLAMARAGGRDEGLRFRKADLLVALERYEEAEELAAEFDRDVYRELIRGRIRMARGQSAEALLALEAGLKRWPNNAAARYLAGQAAEQLGQVEKALSHYREAVRSDADATDAALAAARLHLTVGEYPDAVTFAQEQISKRPVTSAEGHRVLARALAAQGEYDRARRALMDLTKRGSYPVAVAVERAAVERMARGPEAAASVIERSGLDLTAADSELALIALVGDLTALERTDEALRLVAAYEKANPTDASAADLRGRVLLRAGRRDEARAAFETALERDAAQAAALVALSRMAIDSGQLEDALAFADKAVAAAPDDAEAVYLSAQLRNGLGRPDEAIESLRLNTARHPGHAPSANDLAWLLTERGEDPELALALARRGARLSPTADYLDTLGWVYLKQGDAAAAADAFERALADDPQASSVRYRLGLAFESMGRTDDALQSFREALGSGTFPEADAAQAQIARLEAQQGSR